MRRFVSSKGKRATPTPAYSRTAFKIAAALLIVIVVLLNLFSHVFSVVQYYGDGMEPALEDRQILLIRKTDKVKQGDIVACYFNNKILVRRVICTGGTVSISDSGIVTVNGTVLDEPYVADPSIGHCNISFPYSVSVGQYFVLGDNRSIAMDSRLSEIGTIPQDRIYGKVVWVIG